MVKIIITIIALITALPLTCKGDIRTVVPGRTWWYQGSVVQVTPWELFYVTYGLRIASEPSNAENGLYDCYLVDSRKELLIDQPVCKVREENGRVWVVPAMDLYIQYADRVSRPFECGSETGDNELKSFAKFLGYWYGPYVEKPKTDSLISELYRWTDKPSGTEYLLYDYNMQVGDRCAWGWSGEDLDEAVKDPFVKGVIVESVSQDAVGRKIFRTSQQDYYDYHMEVLEGTGVTSGGFASFVQDFRGYRGFWIAPCSPGTRSIPGMYEPGTPNLRSVTEADGTCIFGDPDFEPSLAQIESVHVSCPQSGQLYDLQGRPLSEPVRGQLYVRDGKLQFAK